MKSLFFKIILALLVLVHPLAAVSATPMSLVEDDHILSSQAKDVWYDGDTIDEHIKHNSSSPDLYLHFIFKLAQQVLKYNSQATSFHAQRSLLADSLAIAVSRNFVAVSITQKIDVQKLLDQADSSRQAEFLKMDFYQTVMRALGYSSINTDSFYRRFLKWSLNIDSVSRGRIFQNWFKATRLNDVGLTQFLHDFNHRNKDFLLKLSLKPDTSMICKDLLK